MSNAVVVKHGHARRVDPRTGADKGAVGTSHVVAAASDGTTSVFVYAHGHARRYDATTGAERGSVGTSRATGCSISSGTII